MVVPGEQEEENLRNNQRQINKEKRKLSDKWDPRSSQEQSGLAGRQRQAAGTSGVKVAAGMWRKSAWGQARKWWADGWLSKSVRWWMSWQYTSDGWQRTDHKKKAASKDHKEGGSRHSASQRTFKVWYRKAGKKSHVSNHSSWSALATVRNTIRLLWKILELSTWCAHGC